LNWLIPCLFGASAAGLGYTLSRALLSGAEAYSGAYSRDTARQFEDVFLFIPPRRIAEIGWTAAAASFLLVFLLAGSFASVAGVLTGLLLGTAVGGTALFAPRNLLAVLKRRRLRRFNEQLVDALMTMSNALKAGFSINQAFESVVREGEIPISQEFGVLLQQVRVGVSFSEALRAMEQRVGSDDLTLVVNAVETARRTGGRLTDIFDKIALTIRERMRIESRIRTLTAQGRLQGIIVAAMPVVIAAALIVVDPDLMMPFLRSLTGVIVSAAVAVLIASGWLIIRKIIRIDI
jgi:tight adherence protein B